MNLFGYKREERIFKDKFKNAFLYIFNQQAN